MRKLLMISLGPVILVLLAATVLAAGRGADDRATETPSQTPTTGTSTITAGPIDVPQADPSDAPPSTADETSQRAALHFVCPDGEMDEAVALQRTVDEGHQPWRLSAPDVAAACTFGVPGTAVEPAGTNRYRVSHANSGESAMVDVAQPLGPDGIWVVTSVTPLATTAAETT
jgi:hypothetical protein